MTIAKQRSVSATPDDWEDFKALAAEQGLTPSALIAALAQRRLKLVPAMDNATILLTHRVEAVEDAIEDLRRAIAAAPPLAPTDLP